jgi:hypothetical protein
MATSKTRLIPVPNLSIDQCRDEAIKELAAACGGGFPKKWKTLECDSWAKAGPVAKAIPPAAKGVSPAEAVAVAATVAGYIAKPLIRWFVGKVDKRLQTKVGKYTAVYHGAANFQLYERGLQGPQLAHPCFRLSRLVEGGDSEVVAFDLLAQLHIVDREVLKIRPLRLFVSEIAAKTKDQYLGIAVSLKADVVWRDGRETHRRTEAVAIEELLAHRIETASGRLPLYVTFWDAKAELDDTLWSSFPAQPLPPWSTYDDVTYGGSHLAMDAVVAEAGNAPWLLKNAAKLFHDQRDDIANLLEKAAEKAFEPDAD